MADPLAFRNVKQQVGYCGIWCGSCVIGNGALQELALRFESTLESYSCRQWAPKTFDYDEFAKGLAAIAHVPLCPGCRQGGREACRLRDCATGHQLESCTGCPQFPGCTSSDFLDEMRTGAAAAGLFVLAPGENCRTFAEECEVALKARWPSSILFGSSSEGEDDQEEELR